MKEMKEDNRKNKIKYSKEREREKEKKQKRKEENLIFRLNMTIRSTLMNRQECHIE
jgi:hypothetical protein